ncbi:MAG: glutamate--tRNA ligase, partial [Actinomycetota bacterium]
MSSDIRVRFCPSPTGNPHVGMVRTALFNWAFARHHGGTFVFRIEDTDAERDSEDSYLALLDSLRWLGLDWDEGPEVGGPYAPYRQSERLDIYRDVVRRLIDAGFAYPCYCTPEELEARREQARKEGRTPGYDGHCRDLTPEQRDALAAEGREAAIRLRMPNQDWTWDDLVRGEVTFGREHVPDYVIVRANGDPLYTLVNPVDDALMRITHVLRGEDLLSSTPRQLAMYQALAAIGVGDGTTPRFGHLPYVMGEGNKKLSKRDPESSLLMYRENGYLPEALLNYLALLGWSMGEDREFFS